MVLFGEVLDVTKFLPIHPGGDLVPIQVYVGLDCNHCWIAPPLHAKCLKARSAELVHFASR